MIFEAGFDCNADFAQAIGLHESALSRVLNSRQKINSEQAKRWAGVLGCGQDILESVIR
jgi:plasmid maintenance system antidote protein VapI